MKRDKNEIMMIALVGEGGGGDPGEDRKMGWIHSCYVEEGIEDRVDLRLSDRVLWICFHWNCV